jgi:hypothetical protein
MTKSFWQAMRKPADISPDVSLAELAEIRESWILGATNAGFPDLVWQVLSTLGEHYAARGGQDALIWSWLGDQTNVSIIGKQKVVWAGPKGEKSLRRFTVWLRDVELYEIEQNQERKTRSRIDAIVMSSVPVMEWIWNIDGDKNSVLLNACLFVPGGWADTILAQKPAIDSYFAKERELSDEHQRKTLIETLLVGRKI